MLKFVPWASCKARGFFDYEEDIVFAVAFLFRLVLQQGQQAGLDRHGVFHFQDRRKGD